MKRGIVVPDGVTVNLTSRQIITLELLQNAILVRRLLPTTSTEKFCKRMRRRRSRRKKRKKRQKNTEGKRK